MNSTTIVRLANTGTKEEAARICDKLASLTKGNFHGFHALPSSPPSAE